MPTATMTSRGRITVPKAVRDLLGLKPGDKIVFVCRPEGDVVVEAEKVDLRSLRGMLKHEGPTVSVEEMDGAVGRQ